MSGILMMVIAIVVLGGAYLLYGVISRISGELILTPRHRPMSWRMESIMYREIRTLYLDISLHP